MFAGSALSKNYRKMYTTCPNCGLRYELEVGFFWSAMYIGYALNVALSVTLGIATYIIFDNPDTWVYLTVIVGAILLTYRYNFRYGRAILLYAFAPKYDEDINKMEREINNKTNPNLN
jgi:hypothetical protein